MRWSIVGTLAAVLVAVPAGAGYSAYQQDVSSRGRLPEGTRVGGIDVSGLDRESAVAVVRRHVEPVIDRPVSVRVAGTDHRVSPRRLGARAEVERAVDTAFDQADGGSWMSRSWGRLTGDLAVPRIPVDVVQPTDGAIAAWVAKLAASVEVAPVDAQMKVVEGFLAFTKGRPGATLDTASAATAVREALNGGAPAEVGLDPVAPAVTEQTFGTAILVRTGENKLYLYKNGRVVKTYGVATGAPRFPTPTGRFEVTLKRYRPTWVNPWSKWSMDMPARIGPGPNNPLGTRALNISAPGIRIHGTPAASSIGYSVSHGCIRMRMPEVEELYDLVPTGTPVVIVRGGPARVPGSGVGSSPADVADGG